VDHIHNLELYLCSALKLRGYFAWKSVEVHVPVRLPWELGERGEQAAFFFLAEENVMPVALPLENIARTQTH
jgi:hypothetical protein